MQRKLSATVLSVVYLHQSLELVWTVLYRAKEEPGQV